jgi:hypothetical protein
MSIYPNRRLRPLLLFACLLLSAFLLAACSAPEATPIAAATQTPSPTATDTAEPTSTATSTAMPTATATLTPDPTDTPTPTETATPTATATRKPTSTPRPSRTPTPAASGSSSWERYAPRTLAEIVEETASFLDAGSSDQTAMYLEVDPQYQFPSQVSVIYTGEFRDTSLQRLGLIGIWAGSTGVGTAEGLMDIFAQEMLVTEGESEYWLPVQTQLIPYMEDELTAGDEVTLFILWLGAIMQSGEIDRVYLVNNF